MNRAMTEGRDLESAGMPFGIENHKSQMANQDFEI
jgi:hypothetical protein